MNVWESSLTGLEFYDTCQVAELGDLATEDYLLEPIEDGSTLRPEAEAIAPTA